MYSRLSKKRGKWHMSGELFLWHTKITSKNTLNYRSILFKITSFTISHFNLPLWKAFLCDFNRFHCGWNNRQEHSEVMTSDLGGRKATDSYIFLRVWSYQRVKGKQRGNLRKQPTSRHRTDILGQLALSRSHQQPMPACIPKTALFGLRSLNNT